MTSRNGAGIPTVRMPESRYYQFNSKHKIDASELERENSSFGRIFL